MSASRKRQSPHSRTRCTSIYATQDSTPACFCFPGYSTVVKNTARTVLVKSGIHGFYQYRSGWFYFSLSGSNTAEAGYPGIPRSINMGIRVRLCSDWCLREADILSDYPQTSVSCIVRTQYPYFAQRYAGITGFGPFVNILKFSICVKVHFVIMTKKDR